MTAVNTVILTLLCTLQEESMPAAAAFPIVKYQKISSNIETLLNLLCTVLVTVQEQDLSNAMYVIQL